MDSVIDRFCEFYHPYHDISKPRRRLQRRVLLELEASLDGRSIEEATADDLQAFLSGLVNGGLAASTVTLDLNTIRPFFKWMWQHQLIDAERLMQVQDIKPPRGGHQGVPRPYTRKQIGQLWEDFEEKYPAPDAEKWLRRWQAGHSRWRRVQPLAKRLQTRAVIWIALGGGLRADELFRLQVDDIHHENDYLVARGARKNPEAEERLRAVPWIPPMRDAVREWLEFRELVPVAEADAHRAWLSLHTERFYTHPMNDRTFGLLMHDLGRGWEYRRLRHTAATEMLRAGRKLHTVQLILGHKNIQQTLRYAELVPEDILADAERSESRLSRALDRAPAEEAA